MTNKLENSGDRPAIEKGGGRPPLINLGTSPSVIVSELSAIHSPLNSFPVPKVILEVAEAMTASIDGPGIELSTLEEVLRVALYLDRQLRSP